MKHYRSTNTGTNMTDDDYCYTQAEEEEFWREYHQNTTPEERREIEAAVDRGMVRAFLEFGYTAEEIAELKAKFDTNTKQQPTR